MKLFKLEKRKVVFAAYWLSVLLFLSGLHVCAADSNLGDSDLRAIQTNLVSLYGIKVEDILAVPLLDIKGILENPPNIKDAVFRIYKKPIQNNDHTAVVFSETNYFRCGFASNGYCFAVGHDDSDLNNLSALGNIMGRFGTTNWHASGSSILFDDGVSDSEGVLGRSRSSIASMPLRLGVVPLVVGSARFQGNSQFEARDTVEGKLIKGKLIVNNDQNVSGIEYEIEGLSGWSYIVVFLSDEHQNYDKSTFPLHRWASFTHGVGNTNFFISMAEFSSIQVTQDALPDNYFNPSNWLSHSSPIPVVDAYIVKNQIMVKMDGQLVPAKTSEIAIRSIAKIRVIQAVFILLAIIPVFLLIQHLKRKSK